MLRPNCSSQLQQKSQVVNVYNDPQLRNAQPGVAATINGQQITLRQLAEECIARHGVDVLDSEINRQAAAASLEASSGKSVSREEVNEEIGRAAEAYGYLTADKKPDVDRWLKDITEQEGHHRRDLHPRCGLAFGRAEETRFRRGAGDAGGPAEGL